MGRRWAWMGLCALVAWSLTTPAVGNDKKKDPSVAASDSYDVLFARYLDAARALNAATVAPAVNSAWMGGLTLDARARNINDLVTVRVLESVVATGTADSSLKKNSAGSGGVSKLLGAETKLPKIITPGALIGTSSDTAFKGGGTTTRSGNLTATLTARVVEVFANGDMLLEGVREVDINGDRQIIVLSGIVRQADIDRNNVVLSPSIGQLRIRYFGRGLIRDNLKPGWLIRILNKIF